MHEGMEANAAAKGLQAAVTELGVEGEDSAQAAADECRAADAEAKAAAAAAAATAGLMPSWFRE